VGFFSSVFCLFSPSVILLVFFNRVFWRFVTRGVQQGQRVVCIRGIGELEIKPAQKMADDGPHFHLGKVCRVFSGEMSEWCSGAVVQWCSGAVVQVSERVGE
jgi:hypothetical protein